MARLRGARCHGLWTRALSCCAFVEHVLSSLVAVEACRFASTSSWIRGALFETRQRLQRAGEELEAARLLLRWGGGAGLISSCSLPALADYIDCFTDFYWFVTAVMGKSDAAARSYSRCLAGLCGAGSRSLEELASVDFHAYVRRLPRNSASNSLLSATVRHFIEFRRHFVEHGQCGVPATGIACESH
uniref:Uncharacterized protein n=1 Tax=Pyrodinium bahamense TaxID=73915 RepID=A0A7S0FGR6_9DINO|mmetsp:Transcript_29432/g.80788  ORF Transcript_29432/g.80788 Transcript_29432/m.80788 type:complete len:188 (+) Transcript_29432:73-636(+)